MYTAHPSSLSTGIHSLLYHHGWSSYAAFVSESIQILIVTWRVNAVMLFSFSSWWPSTPSAQKETCALASKDCTVCLKRAYRSLSVPLVHADNTVYGTSLAFS